MNKKIFYEPAGRIHPSQWDLINYPPEGYEFVTGKTFLDGAVVGNNFVFDKLRLQVLDRMMPLNLVKARVDTVIRKVPEDIDLIYAYNHLVFRKIPWVANVEWAHILVGRDLRFLRLFRNYVERYLLSDYCRKIFTWTEVARISILLNFTNRELEKKAVVVPPAIKRKHNIKNYDSGRVRLLFVGSPDDPEDFVLKGGNEVVQTFVSLNEKYEGLELVIRANVPREVQWELANYDNVKIIDRVLPKEDMAKLFKQADIFLFPSHKLHNTVVLEAMSYGLPVVTTDIGSTSGEYVKESVTGFVVRSSPKVPYFMDNYILTSETIHRRRLIQPPDVKVITRLVGACQALIENVGLRKQMGETGKAEIDNGKFSIAKRNETLKKIFDEVI